MGGRRRPAPRQVLTPHPSFPGAVLQAQQTSDECFGRWSPFSWHFQLFCRLVCVLWKKAHISNTSPANPARLVPEPAGGDVLVGWVSGGHSCPYPRGGCLQGRTPHSSLSGTQTMSSRLHCPLVPEQSRTFQAGTYFCPNACLSVIPPAALGDPQDKGLLRFFSQRGCCGSEKWRTWAAVPECSCLGLRGSGGPSGDARLILRQENSILASGDLLW